MDHRDRTADRGTNRTSESDEPTDDSSSGATKRRAVAASAVVAGSSASIERSGGADERPSGERTAEAGAEAESESVRLVLIPMDEYRPGAAVRVVDRLPAPIVVRLLRLPNGETVPVLRRPDEYTGYVARSEPGTELVYSTTVVFARESLETGTCYAFGADAQVFSTRLNLFRATACRVGSADGGSDDVSNSPSDRR